MVRGRERRAAEAARVNKVKSSGDKKFANEIADTILKNDSTVEAPARAEGPMRAPATSKSDGGPIRTRREESPEVIEGGASRRGSERAARDQASDRGRIRPSRSPVREAQIPRKRERRAWWS